ncbi:MAG: hypothetical protein ACK5OX_01780 [Desertimonas sp.]
MGYAMPGAPAAAPVPKRGIRWPLFAAALALAVVGVGLFVAAGMRLSDGVTSLAAAPAGCETVLEFDGGGTYIFFIETRGSLDEIEGTCDVAEGDYRFEETLPRVSLTLVDVGGDEVDLDRVDTPSYDGAGRRGQAIRTAEIDDDGQYVLTVETSEADVVVRVGKDPNRGVGAMRSFGLALGVVGIAGLAASLLLRRKPASVMATASGPATMWQPGQGPPPVAPPTSGQPPHPPYGGPPSGPFTPPNQPGPGGGSWPTPPPPRT